MPLRILAGSVLDVSTTSSVIFGAAVIGYPAANVLTARRGDVARGVTQLASGDLYATAFAYPLAVAAGINGVAICRTNISAAAQAQVELLSGAISLGVYLLSPLAGDGALDKLTDDSSRGINNFGFWRPSTLVADNVYVSLFTKGGSGTVEMGRVMAGVYKELALNFDWGNTVEWVDPGSSAATYGGDLVTSYNGPPRRKITLPFSGIPEADRAYLYDLMRVVGTSGELFISLWPGAGGRLERDHQMWCRIANTDALKQSHVDFYGASITFIEC